MRLCLPGFRSASLLIGAISEQQVRAFLDHVKVNPSLKDQLKAEGSDPVSIAAATGFVFSSADLLRFQAQWLLSKPDRDLNARPCALRVRHWGCWLDVV
jgi:predicted ribosomally synthesized peptide with nif11-like leader